MKMLTPKQQEVYDFIVEFTASSGYPPSIREICAAVNLKSPSSVHAHIKTLESRGYILKDDNKTRAISVPLATMARENKVPILGRVQAGAPVLAIEEAEGFLPFDPEGRSGEFFALRVRGQSMFNAGILDGDYVIVRHQQTANAGDIVVALIEDEATVKRLAFVGKHVWLLPENPDFSPIDGNNCSIVGVVVAVYRSYF
ncbi:MAG: transcriptional repressor LexA [Clostridiales bacterium]|jgi:repressor LexA|nr:transcriptional repressor LexA [Clostridiales bacterium]